MDHESIKTVQNHTVPITIDNIFNRTLTLEDIDIFFDIILEMSDGKADSSPTTSMNMSSQPVNVKNFEPKEKPKESKEIKKSTKQQS